MCGAWRAMRCATPTCSASWMMRWGGWAGAEVICAQLRAQCCLVSLLPLHRNMPLEWRSLPPPEVQLRAQLATVAVPVRLVAGHNLFEEGDPADSFYVLQEGGHRCACGSHACGQNFAGLKWGGA